MSGTEIKSHSKVWVRSLLCITIALVLSGAAFWAVHSIYCISFDSKYGVSFDRAVESRSLVELSQKLGVGLPDFLKGFHFKEPSRAISLAFYIIAVCGLSLAFISRRNVNILPRPVAPSTISWRFPSLIRLFALIAGSLCLAILLVRVSRGQGYARDIITWMVAVICFGMVIADRREGRSTPVLSRGEWIWLSILSVVFALFYMWHATWWLYSSIGDEYSFLGVAMNIVSGAKADPFAPDGVYGDHPWMVSFSQAAVMKVLGENNFGWRASSALFAVLCFIPFYYFMKYYFSKTAAVVGTAAMACSHYLIVWSRMGKPHNNANVFFCLAFASYVFFRRFPLRARSYLSGVIIGLGFYFYHPAKLCLLVIFIFYVVDFLKERSLRRWIFPLSFLIGFLVVIAPLVCHPHLHKIAGVARLLRDEKVQTFADMATYVGHNALFLFFAPLYYPWIGDFMCRNIVDSLSGTLFALGLCWSIVWAFRRRQTASLTVTFVAMVLLVGGATKYNYPKTTRALVLFPWWAAFAGIGAWRLLELGYSFSLRRRLWWGLCGVVVLVLLALNLYQLYGVVPRYYEFVPPVALILREAQAKSSDWHIFYIANKAIENHASNTERVMRLNGYGPRFHRFHDDDLFNGKLWTMLIKPAIIVVDTRKADVERILKEIRERLPHAREEEALATWGKATMQFFYLDKQIELTSPGPLNFTASYDLRSIASRDCYGMVDVTGFEDGTIVVISPVKQESYGIVIADGGKNVTSWLCAKDEGIAWRRARLVPEGPGLMWVVCVHKRPPMVGLYELNGRKIWSESVGEHRLGCGTCTRDGGLLVVSLGGERVWHLDHEGKIEERLCVDMPARELRISAMAVGPDGYIYLVDEAGKKILVLNKDLVFQGEFASPVPFGKEVRLIAGEDKLLYLASGNSLAAIDLSGLERGKDASGLGWTVKLDDFSVCGLTMLGKDRIAIADFSHRGHYPMIWIAEVKPVEQDNVIVPPDAKESSRNTVPVTVVPSL